jgi:hypothetical protein
MTTLVFVDTNIFLDYYRAEGRDDLSILDRFANNKDRIITTTQVEMEYKKNRQHVIVESTKSIYQPPSSIVIPSFLRESHAKSIKSSQEQLSKQTKELKEKTTMLLREPSQNDPVYKSLQKFFGSKAPCHFHVDLDDKIKSEIEEKAHRRFLMGYPPRKGKDSSMGDSINWEWIIHCANKFSCDIIVVSRDGDYGLQFGNDLVLNDWLQQEFIERVNKKCKLTLTTKITEAFKCASIRVTKKQEQSEQQLLEMIIPKVTIVALFPPLGATDVSVTPTFIWPNVNGAIYEFVLAEELGQADKFAVIVYAATTKSNTHICNETLKFSTTYYWRVRAISSSIKGSWLESFFTTKPADL